MATTRGRKTDLLPRARGYLRANGGTIIAAAATAIAAGGLSGGVPWAAIAHSVISAGGLCG